jgi:ATP-dependent RNA helicase DDX19/DBP5
MERPRVGVQDEARVEWLGDSPADEEEDDEEERRLERQSQNRAMIEVEPPLVGDVMKEAARFEDLEQLQDRPDLLRGLYAEGFEAPSTLQRTLLPVLLGTGGRAQPPNNVVVHCTMHGTGKSAALALALLAQVDAGNPATQVP